MSTVRHVLAHEPYQIKITKASIINEPGAFSVALVQSINLLLGGLGSSYYCTIVQLYNATPYTRLTMTMCMYLLNAMYCHMKCQDNYNGRLEYIYIAFKFQLIK